MATACMDRCTQLPQHLYAFTVWCCRWPLLATDCMFARSSQQLHELIAKFAAQFPFAIHQSNWHCHPFMRIELLLSVKLTKIMAHQSHRVCVYMSLEGFEDNNGSENKWFCVVWTPNELQNKCVRCEAICNIGSVRDDSREIFANIRSEHLVPNVVGVLCSLSNGADCRRY